jgi:dynein regulatory complex protein 1
MAKQYEDARTDYADALTAIERAFTHERQAILQRNSQEIERLFKEHSSLEDDYQRQKDEKEKGFMNELEKLKTQQADRHASTKIRLEKEMQTLQKCMEEMKAVYNLNQEKLDFNFKVLKEKKNTSHTMKEKLRIQARKKNDTFMGTRAKYMKLTDAMAKENYKYMVDYKKFTRYFLAVQKKFESFERSDKERYNEILRMNQSEVKDLCQKIMDCDKRIHEQQLGIFWQPPTDPIFKFQDGAMGGT